MSVVVSYKKYILSIQLLLIFSWLSFLVKSDSIYTPYLIVGLAGCFFSYINQKENRGFQKTGEGIGTVILAAVYSIVVLMANYSLLKLSNYPGGAGRVIRLFQTGILFLGGAVSIWNILIFLADRLRSVTYRNRTCEKKKCRNIFLITVCSVSVVNLMFLFLAKYPGTLTSDSLSQIQQIITGEYSNHHPFYHTMIIKLFLTIGWNLFGDINAAVALYSVFQIVFMACSIGFAMLTLYQMNVPPKFILLSIIWYTAMPFHIMYSFTMWKNILFGGGFLLFITAVFRILNKLGTCSLGDYLIAVIGGMGICLLQSNGWFVFLLFFVCFLFLFPQKYYRLVIAFTCITVSTYILTHNVLQYAGCRLTDIIDGLSIPAQQIARVIAEDGSLTNEQIDMLNQVIEVDQVAERYKPYISDPIKSLLFAKGNQRCIAEKKLTWLKLYLEIGLSNPREYIEAWIDQTRGYWNGGYGYWKWSDTIDENEMGIHRSVRLSGVNKFLNIYLWICSAVEPLPLFLCIGFYVWGIVLLIYLCIIRKNKEGFFVCAANLAVIASLWISTPVFSEFRYAYAVFCCFPFLVFAVFYRKRHTS